MPKERREFRISIDVEPTIYTLIALVNEEENSSMSAYVRTCIIKDLEYRGLLTVDVLKRLAAAI